MTRLNELRDNPGARSESKTLGRGIGTGLGKTSGRGHKGQKARSGTPLNGFEGGQNPIYRRLPKRGFNSKAPRTFLLTFRRVDQLLKQGLDVGDDKVINLALLKGQGFAAHYFKRLRIVDSTGEEEIRPFIYEVDGASQTAQDKIKSAKGEVRIVQKAVAAVTETA